MNNHDNTSSPTSQTLCAGGMEECVRRNPGGAIMMAVGAGLGLALLIKALRPEPTPRHALAQLIEDIESRIRDEAEPAARSARKLFSEGADALSDGLHTGEARVEGVIRDARKRLRKLFSR